MTFFYVLQRMEFKPPKILNFYYWVSIYMMIIFGVAIKCHCPTFDQCPVCLEPIVNTFCPIYSTVNNWKHFARKIEQLSDISMLYRWQTLKPENLCLKFGQKCHVFVCILPNLFLGNEFFFPFWLLFQQLSSEYKELTYAYYLIRPLATIWLGKGLTRESARSIEF